MRRGRHEATQGRGRQVTLALLAAIAAVAVTVVVVVVTRGGGGTEAGDLSPTSSATRGSVTPSSASPSASSRSPDASPTRSASSPAMPMSPTVEFRMVGTSWVEVRGPHGRVLMSEVMHKGERKSFNQSRISVTFGNARAVRLMTNGMPFDLSGKGTVRRVNVMRGGD